MIRVLRHYLPLRRALLVFSETLLLSAVFGLGMSWHLLFSPSPVVQGNLLIENLSVEGAMWRCWISAALLAVLSQVAISFNELYDFRISSSQLDRASRFVSSAGSAVAVSLGVVVLARLWELQRVMDFPGLSLSQLVQTLVFTLLLGFALLYLWRHVFHFALGRWNFNARVLVLGAGEAARSLAKEMRERPDSGYEVVALVPEAKVKGNRNGHDDGAHGNGNGNGKSKGAPNKGNGSPLPSPLQARTATTSLLEPVQLEPTAQPASGPLSESLFELVQRLKIDVVVVALEDRRGNLPTEELLSCRLAGIAVKEREALYEHITGKISVEAMRPSYLIFNDGFGRSPKGEIIKRFTDVVLSAFGLLITWPVMVATAVAIRLDSPGSVLFKQERVGENGAPFTVLKFRSMYIDAETKTGPVWASEGDPRITRCGRFIRKTRLDELPQLFNVLAGHMSLVGPRPERPVFVEDLAERIPYFHQRHIVKPGLTGWAQINYPYGNTVEDALQKLQYDLFYIKNQSLLFDLSILFNTIKTVVLRKGT